MKFKLTTTIAILTLMAACSAKKEEDAKNDLPKTDVACSSGSYLSGGSCVTDTFTATYTNNNTLTACDGTQNVVQTLVSCVGQNTSVSDNTKCAATSNVSMQSPAGAKDVAITGGTRHDYCALGSSTVSSKSVTCDSGYYKSLGNTYCMNPNFTVSGEVKAYAYSEVNKTIYMAGNVATLNGVSTGQSLAIFAVDAVTGATKNSFAISSYSGGSNLVHSMTMSPDESSLYVFGDYNQINGSSSYYITKFNAVTGAVDTGFSNSGISGWAGGGGYWKVVASGSDLFLSGGFTGSGARNLFKMDASTGTLDSTFLTNVASSVPANTTNVPYSLAVEGSQVIISGINVRTSNGYAQNVLVSVDKSTGAATAGFTTSVTCGAAMPLGYCPVSMGMLNSNLYISTWEGNVYKFNSATGALDSSFVSPAFGGMKALGIIGYNNSIYIGGTFALTSPTNNSLAKLDASTGARDGSFVASATAQTALSAFILLGELTIVSTATNSPYVATYSLTDGSKVH